MDLICLEEWKMERKKRRKYAGLIKAMCHALHKIHTLTCIASLAKNLWWWQSHFHVKCYYHDDVRFVLHLVFNWSFLQFTPFPNRDSFRQIQKWIGHHRHWDSCLKRNIIQKYQNHSETWALQLTNHRAFEPAARKRQKKKMKEYETVTHSKQTFWKWKNFVIFNHFTKIICLVYLFHFVVAVVAVVDVVVVFSSFFSKQIYKKFRSMIYK